MRSPIPLLALLVVSAAAHSWIYNPTPREYGLRPAEIDNEVITAGCKYTRAEGHTLTYSKGGDLAMRRVSRGHELCVSWMSNGHYNDPGRGWVRLSLSSGGGDAEADFNSGVLLASVDYSAYEGVRILIPPETPLGIATLQFYWDYCGAHRVFTTCADIEIVAFDNPVGHGLGLRGTEQDRYLGHCASTSIAPYPVGVHGVANHCPPLAPPAPGGDHDHGDGSEDESGDECDCECPPVVTNWMCTSV